jgi:uncharacterized oxidoreductase
MNYTAASLESFAKSILASFGCNENEANLVADHLIRANLSGHDSHGIGMLPMYGAQVQDGNLIPNQTPEFLSGDGSIQIVDAKRGFGHRMSVLALDRALAAADEHNVAVLAMRNAGHVSRVGSYAEYCAARGFISIHFVNVWGHPPVVAPFGSSTPGFSTNPISIGIPVQGSARPMLDMATSTVALGKVRVAHNKGESIPVGWVLDVDGLPTTDPADIWLHRRGALTAFGLHKGSGLGIFAELFAGAIAGKETVATGTTIPNGVFNNMFSILVNPTAFDEADAIEARVLEFCQSIKSGQPAADSNEVLLPGEPEKRHQQHRRDNGIYVDNETMDQLLSIAGEFDNNPQTLRATLKACDKAQ